MPATTQRRVNLNSPSLCLIEEPVSGASRIHPISPPTIDALRRIGHVSLPELSAAMYGIGVHERAAGDEDVVASRNDGPIFRPDFAFAQSGIRFSKRSVRSLAAGGFREPKPFLEAIAIAGELVQVFVAAAPRAERNIVPAVTRESEFPVALSTALHQLPPYPASRTAALS
jgi:hypothetical protein